MKQEWPDHLEAEAAIPSYGVTSELVADVVSALESEDSKAIQALVKDMHAADMADLVNRLESDQRLAFIDIVKSKIEPEFLAFLEDQAKEEVLNHVDPRIIAAAIARLDSDDAVYVLEDLDRPLQRKVLRAIPAQNRAMLEEVLTYPEESAGRLMQREIVCVPKFWSIQETLDFIKESPELPETFYSIYVVDSKHRLIGVVPLDVLLKKDHETPMTEVMKPAVREIPVDMDQEEVAHIFQHYALVSAPVISPSGSIVGMITVDDIVDIIENEVEEDIMHLAGVSESDFHSPIIQTSYHRSRWLIATLINTLIAASVISQFEKSIEEKVALSFLMVIVAAMAGNSGMQTIAVTVRALATKEFDIGDTGRAVIKEMMVALITSLFFALVLGIIAAVWLKDPSVGLVLGIALICNMLWAGVAGTFLPALVQRWGMDPAISAGPLLTTTTDVLGYAIFLGLATYFLI